MPTLAIADLERDFPLYAKYCLKIALKNGSIAPLVQNVAQRKVQHAIDRQRHEARPARVVELKSRQTGMSTDAEARLFWDCHMRANRTAVVIAHKRDSAQIIFRMAQRFYNSLPPAMQLPKQHFSKNRISFENGSQLQVEVATAGAGRGFTAQSVHLSELAYYPDPEATLTGVVQSVPPIPESLIVVESTPCGLNAFYDLWINAKSGESDFAPVFVPWFEEPGYRMTPDFFSWNLTDEEKGLMSKHHLDMEQIAWRRWCIRTNCRGVRDVFLQEYGEDDRSCFLVSGRPVFSRDALEYYAQMVPPHAPFKPEFVGDIDWQDGAPKLHEFSGGPLAIVKMPEPRHSYIVGSDPSEGDPGSDPTPSVVMDQMTLEPVALWHGRIRPDLHARKARNLCVLYNRASAIWEANNHGLAFQFEFEKIYDDFYLRRTSQDSVARAVSDKPGYMSTGKSTQFLVDCLRQVVENRMCAIRFPVMVKEMETLYYDPRGRPTHQERSHQDSLVAYALCLEYHRGDPKAELAPLPESTRRSVSRELQRRRVARSMGIDYEVEPALFDITAAEMEEMDEMEHRLRLRQESMGLGERV